MPHPPYLRSVRAGSLCYRRASRFFGLLFRFSCGDIARNLFFWWVDFILCVGFCCSCVENLFFFKDILAHFGLRIGLFFRALVLFLVRFAVFLCVFFVRCAFTVRWRASCAGIVRRAKFWRSCGKKMDQILPDFCEFWAEISSFGARF